MILVDANLLIHGYVSSMPQHERARSWLEEKLNGTARVGLPWPSLLAFLRLVTNRRVFAAPASMAQAWRQVEEWRACGPVWQPLPTHQHQEVLRSLLPAIGDRPNLVPDAHLAALAIEHGLTLCSADTDFARFGALRWENPLE